ncbi:Lipocalin_family conserved site [Hexamita inflata]|uniref:Lipocalin family conserved site n=1 Tax=Hexamita inflata TaxID=28002 RepID=A0AA86QE91_9EUKA|nr:Lipocalin family conserved site [Hexamita inflata]
MPFVVTTNQTYLEIEWAENLDAQELNIQNIHDSYSFINIAGCNSEQQFPYYEILNRAQSLRISEATIDLSKIKGHVNNFTINHCYCINDFTAECIISCLYLEDAQVQVSQLLLAQINQLEVQMSTCSKFDFYNCQQLNCKLHYIMLSEFQLELNKLKGTWTSVNFSNCTFTEQVDNNEFKASTIELVTTESHVQNNFECLENIACDQFYMLVQQGAAENYQIINLSLKNENNQKRNLSAQLYNSISDLNAIQSLWQSLSFNNCLLKGDPKTYGSKFSKSVIDLKIDGECKQIDFSALYGIDTTLNINLFNFQVDLKSINICRPRVLKVSACETNISELVGTWHSLHLISCSFQKCDGVIAPLSIIADKIEINSFDYNYCQYFDTKQLIISKTAVVGALPSVIQLQIRDSTVNITDVNRTITHLTLSCSKVLKFSVLDLKKLESIDLNSIQKTDPAFSTKQAVISYLGIKKKNRSIIKKLQGIHTNQKNRQNIKLSYLSNLKTFSICSLFQPLELFLKLSDE